MNLSNNGLFLEGADDTGALDGLTEEDKDFLKSLEKKATEVESDTEN